MTRTIFYHFNSFVLFVVNQNVFARRGKSIGRKKFDSVLSCSVFVKSCYCANGIQIIFFDVTFVVINDYLIEMVGVLTLRSKLKSGKWLKSPSCQWIRAALKHGASSPKNEHRHQHQKNRRKVVNRIFEWRCHQMVVNDSLFFFASVSQASRSSKSVLPDSSASTATPEATHVSSVCGPMHGMSKRMS